MTRDKDTIALLSRNLCSLLRNGLIDKDQVALALLDALGLWREPVADRMPQEAVCGPSDGPKLKSAAAGHPVT